MIETFIIDFDIGVPSWVPVAVIMGIGLIATLVVGLRNLRRDRAGRR